MSSYNSLFSKYISWLAGPLRASNFAIAPKQLHRLPAIFILASKTGIGKQH
jgi:hypothetical protein